MLSLSPPNFPARSLSSSHPYRFRYFFRTPQTDLLYHSSQIGHSCMSFNHILPDPARGVSLSWSGSACSASKEKKAMVWQRLRLGLLTGAILATAGITVRAGDGCAPAPCPTPCAPATRKVCVKDWVPETYQCKRTVYKTVSAEEEYTAYKCESVPETRTRTVYKTVQETRTEVREVCKRVPVVEERTVMQTHVTCKPVTKMVRKCEDHGHYECREVECGPTLSERLHKCFHRRHKCDDCCETCAAPCPRTKTVKVWVPCKVWVEKPVTCYERVCEQRPVVCKVTTCKTVMEKQPVQVNVCKCVPTTETYTCMVTRQVPVKAKRTVTRCVPTEEIVTATRMVCRTVEKEVPCEAAHCETCCAKKGHSFSLRGLFHHRD